MSDISVPQNASLTSNIKPIIHSGPVYLITLLGLNTKTPKYLVATKLDETVSVIKAKGFYVSEKIDSLFQTYQEVVKQTSPEKYVDITVPWTQVYSVISLSYRHKG